MYTTYIITQILERVMFENLPWWKWRESNPRPNYYTK